MLTGISSACLYPMQTEDAVETICKLNEGISLELFVNSTSELSPKYIRNLKSMLDFYGAKIVSMHPFSSVAEPILFFSNYKRRFDDGMKLYTKYFKICEKLGADVFVFHGDYKLSPTSNEQYFDRYLTLRERAKEYGVILAQENVERCKSHSLDFIKNMKAQLKDDVNFVFDVKQAVRSNVNPTDMVDVMGNSIVHVHLSDNKDGYDCLPIGAGDFNFNQLFDKLKGYEFNRYVILELYRKNFDTLDDLHKGYINMNKIISSY